MYALPNSYQCIKMLLFVKRKGTHKETVEKTVQKKNPLNTCPCRGNSAAAAVRTLRALIGPNIPGHPLLGPLPTSCPWAQEAHFSVGLGRPVLSHAIVNLISSPVSCCTEWASWVYPGPNSLLLLGR